MPVAGDFTAAQLVSAQVKAKEVWADNSANTNFQAEVEAARAIISEQSATIDPLHSDPKKDRVVEVQWLEQCDMTVNDSTDQCTFPAPEEAQANNTEHTIDQCKDVSFTVDENTFRTSNFSREETLAKQFLMADKALAEFISTALVSAVDSFAGANALGNGSIGTAVGPLTTIPASLWTPSVVSYLIRAGKVNKMNNFYQLNGANLFENSILTGLSSKEGAVGDQAKLNQWRQYWDLFNVDSTIGAQVSYLINRGALAFASKARYESTPITFGNGLNQTRFKMASANLAGLGLPIEYDVRYQTRCVADNVHHDYVVSLRYGIFQSPINSCDTDKTGVLKFECV